jgi:hypothetical protein
MARRFEGDTEIEWIGFEPQSHQQLKEKQAMLFDDVPATHIQASM